MGPSTRRHLLLATLALICVLLVKVEQPAQALAIEDQLPPLFSEPSDPKQIDSSEPKASAPEAEQPKLALDKDSKLIPYETKFEPETSSSSDKPATTESGTNAPEATTKEAPVASTTTAATTEPPTTTTTSQSQTTEQEAAQTSTSTSSSVAPAVSSEKDITSLLASNNEAENDLALGAQAPTTTMSATPAQGDSKRNEDDGGNKTNDSRFHYNFAGSSEASDKMPADSSLEPKKEVAKSEEAKPEASTSVPAREADEKRATTTSVPPAADEKQQPTTTEAAAEKKAETPAAEKEFALGSRSELEPKKDDGSKGASSSTNEQPSEATAATTTTTTSGATELTSGNEQTKGSANKPEVKTQVEEPKTETETHGSGNKSSDSAGSSTVASTTATSTQAATKSENKPPASVPSILAVALGTALGAAATAAHPAHSSASGKEISSKAASSNKSIPAATTSASRKSATDKWDKWTPSSTAASTTTSTGSSSSTPATRRRPILPSIRRRFRPYNRFSPGDSTYEGDGSFGETTRYPSGGSSSQRPASRRRGSSTPKPTTATSSSDEEPDADELDKPVELTPGSGRRGTSGNSPRRRHHHHTHRHHGHRDSLGPRRHQHHGHDYEGHSGDHGYGGHREQGSHHEHHGYGHHGGHRHRGHHSHSHNHNHNHNQHHGFGERPSEFHDSDPFSSDLPLSGRPTSGAGYGPRAPFPAGGFGLFNSNAGGAGATGSGFDLLNPFTSFIDGLAGNRPSGHRHPARGVSSVHRPPIGSQLPTGNRPLGAAGSPPGRGQQPPVAVEGDYDNRDTVVSVVSDQGNYNNRPCREDDYYGERPPYRPERPPYRPDRPPFRPDRPPYRPDDYDTYPPARPGRPYNRRDESETEAAPGAGSGAEREHQASPSLYGSRQQPPAVGASSGPSPKRIPSLFSPFDSLFGSLDDELFSLRSTFAAEPSFGARAPKQPEVGVSEPASGASVLDAVVSSPKILTSAGSGGKPQETQATGSSNSDSLDDSDDKRAAKELKQTDATNGMTTNDNSTMKRLRVFG